MPTLDITVIDPIPVVLNITVVDGGVSGIAQAAGAVINVQLVTGTAAIEAARIAAQAAAAAALVSEDNASASEIQTGLDAVATAADRLATNSDAADTASDLVETNQDTIDTAADLAGTNADLLATNADLAATNADVVTTGNNVATTNQDAIDTGLDAIATGNDVLATNADVVSTNADAAATAADLVQTNLDQIATTADAVQTALDVISTANDLIATNADVVTTNADVAQTTIDKAATAADAVQTALDKVATNADVVLTNSDAASTAADLVAVAAIFDNFDDVYLGAKAADPTLDNDGDALVGGQIYWNTPGTELRFYNGAAWETPTAQAATSATNALASENAADASETQTGLDAIATAADRVATGDDVTATNADVVSTNDDVVQTGLDVVAAGNDVDSTNANVLLTNADVVSTGDDAAATALDKIATNSDAAQTALDVIETNQDTIDTAADLAATNQDTIDTAADAFATAADRVQTGLDAVATAADVLLTGSDVTDAEAAKTAAEAAWDSFDDRYLGAKGTPPTLDNDGNALTDGVLYFYTVDGNMYVRNSAVWEIAYASAGGGLIDANNLSDVANALIATQNLSVEVGVDVQAYTVILAATTESFTTALKNKLDGVATGAQVNDATTLLDADIGGSVQAQSAILDATTASFLTADETKLDGIEALAEVNDPTTVLDADIGISVQAYSSVLAATTASFLTTDESKLDGISTGAQVNDPTTLLSVDVGVTVEAFDATILKDADIGSTVQAQSATLDATTASFLVADESKLDAIEALAEVNDVTTLLDADIGVNVEAYDSTILKDADIGLTVEAYDATILKDADIGGSVQAQSAVLDATTASWLTADQSKLDGIAAGAEVNDATTLLDADLGSTVQEYDATILKDADIGSTVEAYDGTILKDADIDVTVQGYDPVLAATTASFLTADESKLDGISTGAEVNPALISQVEAEAGVATTERTFNALRIAQAVTALSPPMSDADVKTAYENNANSNEFSDAEQTKLANVSASADVNDPTTLLDADIGGSVQAHSAVLDATTASFLAADESKLDGIDAGAEVNDATTLLDADIDVTVQGYTAVLAGMTASFTSGLKTNYDTAFGWGDHAGLYSLLAHNHSGVYEPADATIVKDADIGVNVMAYDATMLVDADIGVNVQAYNASLTGTSATFTAALKTNYDTAFGWGDHDGLYSLAAHNHSATYQPLAAVLTNTTASFLLADETKLDFVTVTQAVDLDTIETRVNALDAAVVNNGPWDASVGTFPGGGTAQNGETWIVTVGGTVGGVVFAVNDRLMAYLDNASTTVYASNWLKLDYTDQVVSVAGKTGAVTLVKADVGLANVDNTTDALKPVSGPQQTALDLKLDDSQVGVTVMAYDSTMLVDADIGGSVQAYTAVLQGTQQSFTTTLKNKLDGITASADVNDPTTLLDADLGVNVQAYTAVLQGTQQSFTTTLKNKLDGIATGAEVNPALIDQAEAEAGSATTERTWSALRVSQAINSLGGATENTFTETNFTATAAQTVFTFDYTVGAVEVFRNGSKLASTDFTATNGTSVTLGVAAGLNDIVTGIAISTFLVADALIAADIGNTVQAYDVDTAKLDVIQTFTAAQTFGTASVTAVPSTSNHAMQLAMAHAVALYNF